MSNYKNRLIAFLDILGFKDLVSQSHNDVVYNQIKQALECIEKERELNYSHTDSHYNNELPEYDKEVSVFSDSIVISYGELYKGGTFFILMDLVYICIELNRNGIFVRGGVAFGKLYHKNHICFGPAMVQAYELEQKANYSRIIIDSNVLEHGISFPEYSNTSQMEKKYLKKLVSFDNNDDIIYLDYLSQSDVFDNTDRFIEILQGIKKHLIYNLEIKKNNPYVLEKYIWFAQYYNRTVRKLYTKEVQKKNSLLISNI